ncbi:MAG: phosphatase PAP2 family protein [Nocardiaceae bacterium]|nr:phosphatase PAP2 family protein [Nocardiaceae bacterium]
MRIARVALGAFVLLAIALNVSPQFAALDVAVSNWVTGHVVSVPLAWAIRGLGDPEVILLASAVLAVVVGRMRRSVVHGLVIPAAVGLCASASELIKVLVPSPRPPADPSHPWLHSSLLFHAFPSSHVAAIASLWGVAAVAAFVGRRFLGAALTVIALGVAIHALSNVVVFAHSVSDVVGGALLAIAVIAVVHVMLISVRPGMPRSRIDRLRLLRRPTSTG